MTTTALARKAQCPGTRRGVAPPVRRGSGSASATGATLAASLCLGFACFAAAAPAAAGVPATTGAPAATGAASAAVPPDDAGPVDASTGEPLRLGAPSKEAAPNYGPIDDLLRQGRWTDALAALHAQEKHLASDHDLRGAWLARVALGEAGAGQTAEALWHWAAANALATEPFTSDELRAFGEAGALLAGHPARLAGKAPPGMTLESPGPEVQGAVMTTGELPPAAGAWVPRKWVRLEVVVDAEGHLRDPVVLSAYSPEAAYGTLEAIRNWHVQPARKHGQPVAVLHSIAVNPPGHLPIEKLMALSPETGAIEAALRHQKWKEAAELADRRWYRLLETTDPAGRHEAERAALGMTLALRALARVDQDREHQAWARCRWEAAESLLPSLYDLDLQPYGTAGLTVAGWRMEGFRGPFRKYSAPRPADAGKSATRPRKIKAAPPYYPLAARKQRLTGKVIMASVIDLEGRVTSPAVLQPADASEQVVFAASALDTVCDWRFEPATIEGKPVKVYYTLTVSFEVRF